MDNRKKNAAIDRIVEGVLNEISPNVKRKNTRKALGAIDAAEDNVRTFLIITGENPMGEKGTNRGNRTAQKDLARYLRDGGYAWVPLRGKYGNTENPKMVFNIPEDEAMHLAGVFGQESYIYGTKDNGTVHFDLYMRNQDGGYDMVERQDRYDDMSDADDFYTVIADRKKFSVPYEYFNEAFRRYNSLIAEAKSKSPMYSVSFQNLLDESMDRRKTPKSRYTKRCLIYKGLFV